MVWMNLGLFTVIGSVPLFISKAEALSPAVLAARAKCLNPATKFKVGNCDPDHDFLINKLEKKFKSNPKKKSSLTPGVKDGDVEDSSNPGHTLKEADRSLCKNILDINKERIPNSTTDPILIDCLLKQKQHQAATPAPTAAPGDSATPKPTAVGTPKPAATATPKPVAGGNTCTNGSTSGFGIPAGMTGHASSGASLWMANCMGCHGSAKAGESYSKFSSSASNPVMTTVRSLLSNSQNVADITAYKNCH